MRLNPIRRRRWCRAALVIALFAATATEASAQQGFPADPAPGATLEPLPDYSVVPELASIAVASPPAPAFSLVGTSARGDVTTIGVIGSAGLSGKVRIASDVLVPLPASGSALAAVQQGRAVVPGASGALELPPQSRSRSWNLSAGADVSPGAYGFFLGGAHALNGDFGADGIIVRASLSAGQYEEGNAAGISEVSFRGAGMLVGYQHSVGAGRIGFFAGPEYVHNGSNASPGIRGGSWDLRAVAEASTPIGGALDLAGFATYSTFENQYVVQGQVLYRPMAGFRLGPRASISGGNTWEQYRLGVHADMRTSFGAIGLGVGYGWNERAGSKEGLYASVGLSITF